MKLPYTRRNKGSVVLVIVVLIFLLLFLGFTLWEIWKMIQKLPTGQSNQAQMAGDMLSEFQATHTNEPVSVVSTQMITMTMVQPFNATELTVRIWRSTNLVDWDCIATNFAGNTWTDTNAPWPNGFYKQEVIGQ